MSFLDTHTVTYTTHAYIHTHMHTHTTCTHAHTYSDISGRPNNHVECYKFNLGCQT